MRYARNKAVVGSFVAVLAAALLQAAPAAAWWPDETDEFVAMLNTREGRAEFGVASALRPHDIVNRIDVVFDDSAPAESRADSLRRIGRQFLRLLSERTGITTVTVVERNAAGMIVDRAVVKIVGVGGGGAECQVNQAPS